MSASPSAWCGLCTGSPRRRGHVAQIEGTSRDVGPENRCGQPGRVDHAAAQPDSVAAKGAIEELSLYPCDMGDEDPPGQGGEQLVEHVAQLRGVLEIRGSQAMDADRLRWRHAPRPHEPSDESAGSCTTLVDRDCRVGHDLVAARLEARRLEVHDAEAGEAPWRSRGRKLRAGVLPGGTRRWTHGQSVDQALAQVALNGRHHSECVADVAAASAR